MQVAKTTANMISYDQYLIYDDVCQGAEVFVMLQLPEQDSSSAVQQAGPLPGLILHPDLVPTRWRLKRDFNMKQSH